MSKLFSKSLNGVKVPHSKNTAEMETVKMPVPDKVVIPMKQHMGRECTPTVKLTDLVKVGQIIGDTDAFIGAPIHSSVSGKVTKIDEIIGTDGNPIKAVEITTDKLQEIDESVKVPEVTDLQSFAAAIRASGLVGLGGAGFPTHVKLAPKDPSRIEYILVNGAECEPYITSDYRRMIEEPEKVVKGLQVILTLFDSAKGYICIEDNKPDCIAKMKELVKDIDRIEVKEVMTKYPQGGERTLIYAATGREINSSMLPADVGCVVDNVETVISVYKAVILGRPVNSRVVTMSGDGIKEPKNLLVLSGTDMSELVDAAGGLKAKIAKAISGGPMMGFALYDLHVPCTKTTSAFLFLEHDAVSEAQEIQTACINCGRCVSVCPGHVLPARLAKLAERGDMAGFEAMDGMECCECGCCSYICPAKRPLTQSIKSMRKMVLASRRKK